MSLTKKILTRFLPRPILLWGKKLYYPRVVQQFWEPEVEPIKCFVQAGDSTIDLGANIGWYTTVLSRLAGLSGSVIAVEPIPETFGLLSEVVQKLNLHNVKPLNCAVSDTDGHGVMELPRFDYGGTNFYMAHLVSGSTAASAADRVEVPLRSLDSIVSGQDLSRVTFIKCDVEGHELAVLKGATKFFEKVRPPMMIEVAGTAAQQDDPKNEFFTIMKGYGYSPYWYDGSKLRQRTIGHWSVNYFFLQPEHLSKVAHLIAG